MVRRHSQSRRIPFRDRVDPLAREVTTLIVGGCIATIAVTARQPLLLCLVAVVFGVNAALSDDDAPSAPRTAGHVPTIQEVGSLSDEAFDALLDEVDRQATLLASGEAHTPTHVAALDRDEFEELVRDAVDDLPDFVLRELEAENIAVTVSDAGHKFGAYGLYVGGSLAYDDWASQILIFRDTLTRDFGADRDELCRQVITTLRHEVAHHLGAGERHVRDLGL